MQRNRRLDLLDGLGVAFLERLADSPATFEISKDGLGCPLGFFGNSIHGESRGGYGRGGVPLRAE